MDNELEEINKIIEMKNILKRKRFSFFLIRCFDIVTSFFGIILLLPIFAVVSLIILIKDGRPVLFKQERVGKKGKVFKILKYRTMIVQQEDDNGHITIGDDDRITKVGRKLRKLKIDELPQLFNVFVGQMSLVGPRPDVLEYVNNYTEYQKCILMIRPGITSEASLKYYNESEILAESENPKQVYLRKIMPDKINININSMKKMGLFYNIGIIFKTVFKKRKKNGNDDFNLEGVSD